MDAEDNNGRIDYGLYRWSFEDPSEKVFRDIAKRLKKVAKLKRKRRHDAVESATSFFTAVVQNPELTPRLDDCMDHVLDAVAVISESLFQLLEEGDDIYQTTAEFSSNVCLLLEHLEESLNADNVVRQTSKLYAFYLDLAIESPNSWLHSLVTAGPIELISLACSQVENKNLVIDGFQSKMLQIHNAVTYCGDFECQRSLLVALLSFLVHVTPELKSRFLRESFTLLPRQYRKILLQDFTLYDVDCKARYFLNALNKELNKNCRPTSIYSIICSNVFLDGERIKPPQHVDVRDFWVDFSCKSKRIHFYSSCSNENEWRTNSFRKDQVDSVCIFYPSKPNESQITDRSGYVDNNQATEMTQQNDNSVIYIHFLLVDGVDHLSVFSETTTSNKKSLVFELKNMEKVEKALEFFQFDTHQCDVETYKRLVPPPRDSQDMLRSQIQAPFFEEVEVENSDHESPIPNKGEHTEPETGRAEVPIRPPLKEPISTKPTIISAKKPKLEMPSSKRKPTQHSKEPPSKAAKTSMVVRAASTAKKTKPEVPYRKRNLKQMSSKKPSSTKRAAATITKKAKPGVPCWKRTPTTSPEPDFSDPYNLVAVMKYHEAREKDRKKRF